MQPPFLQITRVKVLWPAVLYRLTSDVG